ncbi:hypothetical protein SAMN04487906_2183 [Zhouia amylolytica]|uniref:Serine aminopeptidase S33 domain-containing protein n=1 Tax=Zhouia amylolytica TaxID=376730 RepID=A0A1I6TW00_9FLAO|nr:alpha/beta fold hydrolase [Zhouia amylolytica]MCQ0112534.1 alpha/beta hydrolase [Zhouia amylolytica]SFS93340.1 hypothetical protein SAMN04487906_2183 [Zhouia amylolytica]
MKLYLTILSYLFCIAINAQTSLTKELNVVNELEGVVLSGTLTLPEGNGPFLGVVLIAGTGEMDRDQTYQGHKFFSVLAYYLAKNGIASYRYDKRGVGKSTGEFDTATLKSFASDARAALKNLKTNVKISKVGFVGQSEGTKVASMAALKNEDCSFLVLMSPYALPSDQGLLLQTQAMLEARGVEKEKIQKQLNIESQIWELIKSSEDITQIRGKAKKIIENNLKDYIYINNKNEEEIEKEVEENLNWFVNSINLDEMRNYNDANFLNKLNCDVFAITGDKDLFVVYPNDFNRVKSLLESNNNIQSTFKIYPGLNHLFQNCRTGLPEEVGEITETIDMQVMRDISQWINKKG